MLQRMLFTYLLTAVKQYHINAEKLNKVQSTEKHSDLCRFPASGVAILRCAVLGLPSIVKLMVWLSSLTDTAATASPAAASPPATGEELITLQPTMCQKHAHTYNCTTHSFILILSARKAQKIICKLLQDFCKVIFCRYSITKTYQMFQRYIHIQSSTRKILNMFWSYYRMRRSLRPK